MITLPETLTTRGKEVWKALRGAKTVILQTQVDWEVDELIEEETLELILRYADAQYQRNSLSILLMLHALSSQ